MKAINTLEVSSSLAIQQNSVRTLDQIVVDEDDKGKIFGKILKKYANFTKIPNSVTYASTSGAEEYTYVTKDGIFFMYNESSAPVKLGIPGRAYSGFGYPIYIDVNGVKAPNLMGKDLFLVWLDTKGVVIPFGSFLQKNYAGDEGGASVETWETLCPNKNSSNITEPPADPAACAGAIVDNSGRVMYNYDAIKAVLSNSDNGDEIPN